VKGSGYWQTLGCALMVLSAIAVIGLGMWLVTVLDQIGRSMP
jgi:hypothetical protein